MGAMPDPRVFPAATAAAGTSLPALALRVSEATSAAALDAAQRELANRVQSELAAGDADGVASTLAGAPSVTAWRALWRAVCSAVTTPARVDVPRLEVFAVPLAIVAASPVSTTVGATLPDVAAIVRLLREEGLVAGTQSVAVGDALVGAERLSMPTALALCAPAAVERTAAMLSALELPPDPLPVVAGQERIHLRFLVGTALATGRSDPFAADGSGNSRMALTRLLSAQLAAPPATVLPLAGPARRLPVALVEGRRVQRDAALQLFVGNAVRRLRTRFGEPVAVLSAHRATDAAGGGELRLSLSSPLNEPAVEGFRCPLFPGERVAEVAAEIAELLADCRVTEVQRRDGVHPDLDASGRRLFFGSTESPSPVPR